jgi:predicted outer membrane repeat protein
LAINNLRYHSSNLFIFITVFIALTIILSFGMGNVAAANPGDIIYVNSSGGHDSNNGSSWLYAKQSISNAIGTVNTNGTVNIADGQYTGSSNSGITINKNMTIIGESQANTIINGQQSGKQIFTIIPGIYVTIINLTFTNNNATGYGGVIYNNGTLTVTNNKFTNNYASWDGGVIYNSGTLTGNNNIFNNNNANTEGGAIYNNNTLTETNSTFYNNTATAAGGAIFNEITLTLNNNTFNNNTAQYGGAILNWEIMTDTNNTFSNNIATDGGAAINNQDNLIENNDTFINNTSMSGLGGAILSYNSTSETNCTFTNNTVLSGPGGAIMSFGALTVTNNIYTNNTAMYGGAIYNFSRYYFDGNNGILNDINCIFISNTATADGGAIYNNGTLIGINNTFTNNIASYGGAIYNDINFNLTDTNSIYTNNTATYGGAIYNNGTLSESNGTYTKNSSISGGGAIENEGTITDTNSTYTNNNAPIGGAICTRNGSFLTINNDNFIDNVASLNSIYGGGAIYNDQSSNLILVTCNFTANNAYCGGAISNEGNVTDTSSNFTNNTANFNSDWGGAIENIGTLNMNNSTFTDNSASYGGAIDSSGGQGTLIINNSTFTNNNATEGGAIETGDTLTVNNSTFINNTAINSGGAINNGGTLTILSSNFINNTSTTNNGYYGGGAISNDGILNVHNNNFSENNATTEGGAIYNDGTLIVNMNNFTDNIASVGGAIYDVDRNNSVVEFNRIVGNSNYELYSTGNSLDANQNWWGSNNNPSNYVNGNITVTSWLVLTINANPITIPCNSNSTIIVNLLLTNNGTIENSSIPDGVPMTFTTNLGSINRSSSLLKGSVQSILNSGVNAGVATVSATLDNQLVSVDVDNIIPTASATPAGGFYNTTQSVTLTMNEPGTIYYTTDGTNPTNTSTIYTGPINISANTTLNYLAIDPAGNTSPIYTQTYTIDTIPPVASFTANTTNGTAPLNIQFNDQSTGNITNYNWNFGDGNTSTEQNPTHTYNTPGTYNVTETVTEPGGNNTQTQTNYITVNWPTPVASFTANTTNGIAPLPIQFTDNSTGNIISYYWNFGDGNSSTDQNPTHTYNTPGTYNVTETVTGPGGNNTQTQTNLITVNYPAPIASFTANTTSGTAPLNIQFNDQSTGNINSYYWNFGDGNTSTDENPSHIYNTSGTYVVKETVTGPGGNNSITSTITIIPDTSVPVPIASLKSGIFNSKQIVTLSDADNDPNHKIYYTLNGTTPTTSSTLYTEPLTITKTTTLEFIAADTSGNISNIGTTTYIINITTPTASANYQTGYYNTTKNITLSMSEAGNIYYTINGTTPTNTSTLYNGAIIISKNTTLKYIAINNAGNISSVYTQTYTIDLTIPTASANVKSGVYNTNKVVTLTMSEPGNIYYTLNGTTPTSKSLLYTKPITISSTSTLKYIAIDTANNKSSIYVQNYTIDKTAPTIAKTNPKYNAINVPLTTPLTITFSENILKGTNYNNIYVKNVNTGKLVQITKTISKNTLTINMTKSRLHNDKYIIYIPKDAFKDQAGNQTAAYTTKFKTD